MRKSSHPRICSIKQPGRLFRIHGRPLHSPGNVACRGFRILERIFHTILHRVWAWRLHCLNFEPPTCVLCRKYLRNHDLFLCNLSCLLPCLLPDMRSRNFRMQLCKWLVFEVVLLSYSFLFLIGVFNSLPYWFQTTVGFIAIFFSDALILQFAEEQIFKKYFILKFFYL